MSQIRIFKFGGASVKSAEAVKNVAEIIRNYKGNDYLVVVVSAMGKTTNALEVLVNKGYKKEDFTKELDELRNYHYQIIHELFQNSLDILKEIDEVFEEIRILLSTVAQHEEYNFIYDQVVCQGEILSTKIVSAYLNSIGIITEYKDARGLVRTDNTYREGKVNWNITEYLIKQHIEPIFTEGNPAIVVTQGFIGKSSEGHSTTLGREGSDYTAAIFAYSLNAADVTIWKDVPGVLNADPKYFEDAQLLNQLSYYDAIEFTYYGATVIHPKTMKPLQNKHITLRVKSFIHPEQPGTIISDKEPLAVIPSFIFKVNQSLISISPKDFSFIMEENLSEIYALLAKYRIKVNLMQHSALSFQVCVDFDEQKITPLLIDLERNFMIEHKTGLELITVRNYNQATVERLLKGKELLVEQKNSHTVRLVVENK